MKVYIVIDGAGAIVPNVVGSNKTKAMLRAEDVLDDSWDALQEEGYRLAEGELTVTQVLGLVEWYEDVEP